MIEDCGFTYQEYEEALKISERGNIIILKRGVKDRMVNNYNPVFLSAWNANLDLQVCVDNYAVITYITDYLTKGDSGLTSLLKKAITDTKGMSKFDKLNYVKKLYFTYKEVCVAEAAYRLIPAMYLKRSDRQTRFLQTGFKDSRSCLPRRIKDDEETSSGESFEIEGRDGKYCQPLSVHNLYAARPEALEDICLVQFYSHYVSCSNVKKDIFDKHGDISELEGESRIYITEKPLPKFIKIKLGREQRTMKLRLSPLVVRVHASRHKETPHEQLFSEMQMFLPWRDEEKDLYMHDGKKCHELYINSQDVIDFNRNRIFPFAKMIEVLKDWVDDDFERPAHLFEGIDQTAQQENSEDLEEMEPIDSSELPDEDEIPRINVKKNFGSKEVGKFKPIVLDDLETMIQNVRKLSFEQRIVFDEVINYCITVLIQENGGNVTVIPPKLIVTGNNLF